MISKAQIKHIRSLDDKKYRNSCDSFVVETPKLALEVLNSALTIKHIFATEDWADENFVLLQRKKIEVILVKEFELDKISFLKTPHKVVCEVAIPQSNISNQELNTGIVLMLDTIQDPGNMGTIIRTAEWFGISHIVCSHESADVYNPKVVQASMGSLLRMQVVYADLEQLLSTTNNRIYATTLDGSPIHTFTPIERGIIIIGNEGNGIRPSLIQKATHKLFITGKGKAESLNAAVATGIVCSHLLG